MKSADNERTIQKVFTFNNNIATAPTQKYITCLGLKLITASKKAKYTNNSHHQPSRVHLAYLMHFDMFLFKFDSTKSSKTSKQHLFAIGMCTMCIVMNHSNTYVK